MLTNSNLDERLLRNEGWETPKGLGSIEKRKHEEPYYGSPSTSTRDKGETRLIPKQGKASVDLYHPCLNFPELPAYLPTYSYDGSTIDWKEISSRRYDSPLVQIQRFIEAHQAVHFLLFHQNMKPMIFFFSRKKKKRSQEGGEPLLVKSCQKEERTGRGSRKLKKSLR